jgi:hypothetical protein
MKTKDYENGRPKSRKHRKLKGREQEDGKNKDRRVTVAKRRIFKYVDGTLKLRVSCSVCYIQDRCI